MKKRKPGLKTKDQKKHEKLLLLGLITALNSWIFIGLGVYHLVIYWVYQTPDALFWSPTFFVISLVFFLLGNLYFAPKINKNSHNDYFKKY